MLRAIETFSSYSAWSDEQMQAAMNSVLEDGVSANKAAIIHRVPCSTLKD